MVSGDLPNYHGTKRHRMLHLSDRTGESCACLCATVCGVSADLQASMQALIFSVTLPTPGVGVKRCQYEML